MSEKELQAMEQIEELASYLLEFFPDEMRGEGAVELAIRLLNKLREVLLKVHMDNLQKMVTGGQRKKSG